ncbi:MAG: T9SS type A sorting domain-containing protein [Bacteroidetes bacterium]|nr:T9SS type A sorting domain-containing protein [Bacteroidota bacterium]
MVRIYLTFIIVLFCNIIAAQTQQQLLNRTKHWRFGHKAGLDFNMTTGVPTVFNGSNGVVFEGNSCISDDNGNLLFYCNGDTIWNKNHQMMLNGASLTCDKNTSVASQIIPRPGNPNQFFVFINGCTNDACTQGLRYCIVDMTLDGGNGAVVTGQKNILVRNQAYQYMAFTKHGNGTDYWLAYIEQNSPYYLCMIPVSASGPDTNTRVISSYPALQGFGYRFSPDGTKFVDHSPNYYHFYQFDNNTGQLSNQIILNNDTGSVGYTTYSCEFSPNSNKIYFAHIGGGLSGNVIQQYDISVFNQLAIQSSVYNFWDVPFPGQTVCFCGLGHMQLAPNGKIYIARTGGFIDTLHVIHNPNLTGAACNFQYNAIGLNNNACNFSLPIFPNYYFNNIPLLTTINEKNRFNQLKINAYPNPCNNELFIQHPITNNYNYTLYNNLNQIVFTHKSNLQQHKINTNQLPNGLYWLTIQSTFGTQTKKIIINH